MPFAFSASFSRYFLNCLSIVLCISFPECRYGHCLVMELALLFRCCCRADFPVGIKPYHCSLVAYCLAYCFYFLLNPFFEYQFSSDAAYKYRKLGLFAVKLLKAHSRSAGCAVYYPVKV